MQEKKISIWAAGTTLSIFYPLHATRESRLPAAAVPFHLRATACIDRVREVLGPALRVGPAREVERQGACAVLAQGTAAAAVRFTGC
jgi:hypothetical protein